MPKPTLPQPFTPREARDAKTLMRKLFGPMGLIFYSRGQWHLGRLIDGGPPLSGHGEEPIPLHRRAMEIFAVAPGLTEAMQVFTGGRLYSFPGVTPTAPTKSGYRPVFDGKGQIRGYESPSGVFSKRWPSDPGTAN